MLTLYAISTKQLLRQPQLWLVMAASVIACEILPAFELFSFDRREMATLDILKATLFFCVFLSLLISSYQLLGKELHDRVALVLFTKPISYFNVILAKLASLLTVLSMICLMLGLWILKQGWYMDWSSSMISYALVSIWCVFLQGAMILSVSVAITILAGSISGIVTPIIFIVISNCVPGNILPWLSIIIPPFPWFDLSASIFSQELIPVRYLIEISLYAVVYSLWAMFISSIALKYREY